MAKIVKYTIEGDQHSAEHGASLLSELRKHGYDVPSLCHHESLTAYGACRLCLVEVRKGKRQKLTTSCNYPVQEGIKVFLDTEKVVRNRQMILELHLARAPGAKGELPALAAKYGVGADRFPPNGKERCILCGLCVRACSEGLGANALTFSGRGDQKELGAPYSEASACVGCGACAACCPTGAIDVEEYGATREIWGRTFEFQKCSGCGALILPKAQIELLVERTALDSSYFELCDACRRRATADGFKAVMGE